MKCQPRESLASISSPDQSKAHTNHRIQIQVEQLANSKPKTRGSRAITKCAKMLHLISRSPRYPQKDHPPRQSQAPEPDPELELALCPAEDLVLKIHHGSLLRTSVWQTEYSSGHVKKLPNELVQLSDGWEVIIPAVLLMLLWTNNCWNMVLLATVVSEWVSQANQAGCNKELLTPLLIPNLCTEHPGMRYNLHAYIQDMMMRNGPATSPRTQQLRRREWIHALIWIIILTILIGDLKRTKNRSEGFPLLPIHHLKRFVCLHVRLTDTLSGSRVDLGGTEAQMMAIFCAEIWYSSILGPQGRQENWNATAHRLTIWIFNVKRHGGTLPEEQKYWLFVSDV